MAVERERQRATASECSRRSGPKAAAQKPTCCAVARPACSGRLSIDGVGERYSAAMVKVFWLDGQSRVYTLTAGQPALQLYGSADDQRGMGEIARAYPLLGIEHILSGIDHLLFVLALAVPGGLRAAPGLDHHRVHARAQPDAGQQRARLAHAALARRWRRRSRCPSCWWPAKRCTERETLARRWPALVAFLFGLVHGLGFAGALQDIGLPQNHLSIALFFFNIGVEVGQLLTVALAWLIHRALRSWPAMTQARVAALYAIGTLAAYWSLTRIAAMAA